MLESKKKPEKKKKAKVTYEVRQVSTPQEVVMVSKYKDNFDELTDSLSRSEMIQLLMNGLTVPDSIVAWGVFDNANRLKGYLVALNAIMPPLSKAVTIIYAHSTAPTRAQKQVLDCVEAWAKELGATNMIIQTTAPSALYTKYGFKDTGMIMMDKHL